MLLSACQKPVQGVLFNLPSETTATSRNVPLTEMLGDYRFVQLEVVDKSLVGLINKVIKRDGVFYILCESQRILSFDDQGKFLNVFNRYGRGDGEYGTIWDFNIYTSGGKTEIWLCDSKTIKIYDASTFECKRSIQFDCFINKFVKSGERLLLLTGQNDNTLSISDLDGVITDTYLERDPGSIIFRPVNFVQWQDKYIYQIGVNSSCVVYDSRKDIFEESLLFEGPSNVYAKEANEELSLKYREEAVFHMDKYILLRSFRNINGNTVALFKDGAKSYLYTGKINNPAALWYIDIANISNDIKECKNLNFLNGLIIGDSDESLLSIVEVLDIKWPDNIDVNNQNPAIIEWKMK